MLGLLFYLFCIATALGLLRLLPLRLTLSDQLSWSVISGTILGSWIGFLTSWTVGYSIGIPLTILILIGLVVLSANLPTRVVTLEPELPPSEWGKIWHGLLVMGLVAFFGFLTITHFLEVHADGWYSSGYTWSDLAAHMSIISGVVEQARFSFANPIFVTAKLSYPFLFDFLTGVMIRLGSSWQVALVVPTIATFLALCQVFLSLSRKLLASARAAWIHLGLFLLSGSTFGIVYAYQAFKEQGWAGLISEDFAYYETGKLFFGNILTTHLLPQRGYLMGFAAALLVIQLCRIVARNESRTRTLVWIIGGLVGLMPFVHVHTFFVLFGLLVILFLTDVLQHRSLKTPWGIALSTALVIALPQVSWQFSNTYSETFGRWYLGWMRDPDSSVLLFWLRNFGLVLVFIVANFFIYTRWLRDQFMWQLYLLAMLIFIAINVRIFQPNDFDNMKLLIYAYWSLTLGIAYMLAKWSRKGFGTVVAVICFLSLTTTGFLALLRETQLSYQEFSTSELDFIEKYRALVPSDALVLTSSRHNHVIPTLGGRRIVMGYPGWLWTYGIDSREVERNTREVWWGTAEAANVIHTYGITHIAFSEDEIRQYGINLRFFDANYTRIYSAEGWYIYSLK